MKKIKGLIIKFLSHPGLSRIGFWVRSVSSLTRMTMKKNLGIVVAALLFVIISGYIFRDKIPFFSASAGANPVSYWRFDEGVGNTAADFMGANNGTLGTGNSAPTWVNADQCIFGKCLQFDGTNDYVNVGDVNAFEFTGDFTISIWAKSSSSTVENILINYGTTNDWLYSLSFDTANLIDCKIFNSDTGSGYLEATSTRSYRDSQWHNISCVVSGTNLYLYVDGQMVASDITTSGTRDTSTTGTLSIGKFNWNTQYFYKGYLDEPKIYNYARTASQIQADYASRGTIKGVAAQFGNTDASKKLSDGLVGYWKMDESTGTTTADFSGSNNTGNFASGTQAPSWSSGKFGSGLSFDGTDDYITKSNFVAGTGNFTLSSWFNLNSSQSSSSRLQAIFGNDQNTPFLSYRASTKQFLSLRQHGGGSETITFTATTNNLADSSWHHVAMVVDQVSYNAKLFVDGVLISTQSIGTEGYTASNGGFQRIGYSFLGGSTGWTGNLDEMRVYNRALDAGEVKALYQFAPGPVGYWKMDESSGTTANDSSGIGNTGTLGGTILPQKKVGKYGQSLFFTADTSTTGSKVTATSVNMATASSSSETIALWVNPGTQTNASPTLLRNGGGNDENYDIFLSTLSGNKYKVSSQYHDGSGFQTLSTTNQIIPIGSWSHLEVIFTQGVNVKVYLNGSLNQTIAWSGNPSVLSTTNLIIGSNTSTGASFDGYIDDVKIYNYARTASQIIEDMNGGHPAVGTPVGSTVLHLKMNEGYGSTTYDISPQQNNGTLGTGNSAPTWTNDGKFKKALSFDGTNDYVGIPDNSVLSITGDLTVSSWVKITATNTNNYGGVAKYANNGSYSNKRSYGFWFLANTTTPAVGISDDGTATGAHLTSLNGNTNIGTGTWAHIAFVYKPSTYVRLYINGKLDSETTSSVVSSIFDSNAPLWIGTNFDNGDTTRFMKGQMDEVKIYPFALTDDQVKVDFNQGKAQTLGALSTGVGGTSPDNSSSRSYCVPGDASTCSAPVGEWLFNETIGTSAPDTSTNGNTGTLTNGPIWYTGKIGNALSFDGVNDYFTAPDSSSLRLTSTGTVSVWVKPTAYPTPGNWMVIFNKGSWGSGKNMYGAYYSTTTNLCFNVEGATSSDTYCIANTYTPLNQWTFLTLMWDGTNSNVYINGVRVSGHAQSQTPDTSTFVFELGNNGGIRNFSGLIDQVRVYNYARTAAQNAWEYNQGAPVAYYKLNECTGTTAADSSENSNGSTNGNNGTIVIGSSGTQTSAGTCSSGNSAHAWNNGTTGKYGASLNFDGTDDYVSITDSPLIQLTNKFTFSSWVNMTTAGRNNQIFAKGNNNTTNLMGLLIDSSNKAHLQLNPGTGSGINLQSNQTLSTGTWYHLTFTYDSSLASANGKIYINGILDNTRDSTLTVNTVGLPLSIATDLLNSGRNFSGKIDDIKIFNYPLTPAQVKVEMLGGAVRYQ